MYFVIVFVLKIKYKKRRSKRFEMLEDEIWLVMASARDKGKIKIIYIEVLLISSSV